MSIQDYISFIDIRSHRKAGGVLFLINSSRLSRTVKCFSKVSNSDTFNIAVVIIGKCDSKLTIVAAYCLPWAASNEANAMIKMPEQSKKKIHLMLLWEISMPRH